MARFLVGSLMLGSLLWSGSAAASSDLICVEYARRGGRQLIYERTQLPENLASLMEAGQMAEALRSHGAGCEDRKRG